MCIGLHTLPPCLLFCGNYILHESEYDVHIFCVALDIIIYPTPLEEKDIRHKILVIKINRLYQRGMDEKVLYDAVRGVWRASKKKVRTVEYVFGVYNSLIVAVYKPSEWFVCKEAKDRLPRQDIVLTPKTENRLFFVDERYEQGFPSDENESFYIGKSIAGLKLNQSAQNPITYLYPLEKDKIHI